MSDVCVTHLRKYCGFCFIKDKKETPVIETLTHEVVTGKREFYVNGLYVSNEKTALAEVAALIKEGKGQYTFEVIPETREKLTLYPLGASGWSSLDHSIRVYWKVTDARTQNKIQVIKLIRELTSLGLKESKDLVEGNEIIDLGFMPLGVARMVESLIRISFMKPYLYEPCLFAEHV